MGLKRDIRSIVLQGDFVSSADTNRTNSILGAVAEEVAVRLAECVCTVLRCSGAIVVVLASVCAQGRLS